MKWQQHLTSIALCLAAAGVGVYAWVDRDRVSEGEKKAREGSIFPAWRREDISRIELEREGEKLVLQRVLASDAGDNGWHMISPRADEADAAAVDKLLQQLELGNSIRKVVVGGGAGLEKPRLRGAIVMGTITFRFALGDAAPTPEGAAYMRVEAGPTGDARTIVVPRELVTELLKGQAAYRARTIVPYLSIDLATLEVRGPSAGAGFAIHRIDEVSFRLGDTNLRASRDGLDRVWRALAEMRAEAFPDEAEAKRALLAPAFTILMTPKDGARAKGELVVGGACPGYPDDLVVVRTTPNPLAACAPKGILPGLGTTSASLVDRRLFAAHDDEMAELRLVASPSGASVDLARRGTGWHGRAPRDYDLTHDEVEVANGLATALARAEGDLVSGGEALRARAAVRGRATATRADSGGDEVIELLAVDGEAYVRRLADGAVLRVANDIARKLSPRVSTLRGRQIWSQPIDGKPVRALSARCDGVLQEISRDGETWRLHVTGPDVPAGVSLAADVPAALELAEAISRARAESWAADADDGTFGLGAGSCAVSLSVADEGGTRTVSILLGAEGEGGVYARVEGDPAIFVLPPRLGKLARALLIDLHAFSVDPASVSAVILTRGARKATLAGKALPESVLTALGQLRADTAAHLGPPISAEGFASPTLEVAVQSFADAGAPHPRIILGRPTVVSEKRMYFARIGGVDATFLLAEGRVQALIDATEPPTDSVPALRDR